MLRLLLARHGQTDWNTTGRFCGQVAVGLNEIGHRQAAALADRLAEENIQTIHTSDLRRAQETAQAIAARTSRPVNIEPDLREISFGAWEGLTYDEIRRKEPEALAGWESDWVHRAAPGGERLVDLEQRVRSFFEKIRRGESETTLLIVAHGGTLQVLICRALELPARMYWQFHLSNASVSEIQISSAGGILMLLNDTGHLEKEEG